MQTSCYFGTTKLEVESELSCFTTTLGDSFSTQVLPVAKTFYVEIQSCDALNDPEEWDFEFGRIRVLQKGFTEKRIYLSNTTNRLPVITSERNGHRITVKVDRKKLSAEHMPFIPWYYFHLEDLLLESGGIILHSASIIYRNTAILFSAPSGTGKTTQTDLWHTYYAGVEDINGDLTLLQKYDRRWYACGFPLSGSSKRCYQCAVPLRCIAIVRQAGKNSVHELSAGQKIPAIYSQLKVPPFSNRQPSKAIALLEDLLNDSSVEILQLDCTISSSAVKVLHSALFGE